MLKITIPIGELWNPETEEFISKDKETELVLEHSLVSVSKWESKYHKPFLTDEKKTEEEILYYIKCMTITQHVNDLDYMFLSPDNIKQINSYIEDTMTATTITDNSRSTSRKKEIMTNELIYYYMIACEIPMECQKWHLNRLLTLIQVCGIKNNQENNKMSKKDTMKSNAELNKARRAKLNSKG